MDPELIFEILTHIVYGIFFLQVTTNFIQDGLIEDI